MGLNLEVISDGLLPFQSFIFLYTPNSLIDQYKLKLRGFIKIGGIKRKYIETILESILDPSMCWIVFSDAHKITNESYMYAKLIENNEEPTGLALKNKINTKKVEKIND